MSCILVAKSMQIQTNLICSYTMENWQRGACIKGYTNNYLRWLDWIFLGRYLPSLSLNYVGMSKDIEKRLPQLYYIKMKIS